ncbi:MAG TPA: cinnamycin family lantibiotic [Mycobacteriales bacterium]|nr:cinnamycin family lantibiotic [Mycobacteriales bacterium]
MTATMMHQAAADSEFRGDLLAHPGAFGVAVGSLPAPVQQPDQESLDFWTEGVTATEIYACATSCSFGPFTIVCDGTTK